MKDIVKAKELPIMDERVFRAEPVDARGSHSRESHSLRLDRDSYILCYTGRRGGGKTTGMTFFAVRAAALYQGIKIVSNYPIDFMMRRHRPDGKSYLEHVKAEPLDFEKLFVMDEEYKHSLILIDEAADVISHMASQTWRNRLVAAFVRQIRKNSISLFLASQSFELIDKSMRWQVDVVVDCRDAARYIGDNSNLEEGEMLWLNWYDESGQWTGVSSEERLRRGENPRVLQMELYPRLLWGDHEHEAVFDSWHQINILDSLRKVDLKLSSIKVGDKAHGDAADKYPVSQKTLRSALVAVEETLKFDVNTAIYQQYFYDSLGGLTDSDKNNLGKVLTKFNVERGRDSSNGKRWLGFSSFDIEGFRAFVNNLEEIT